MRPRSRIALRLAPLVLLVAFGFAGCSPESDSGDSSESADRDDASASANPADARGPSRDLALQAKLAPALLILRPAGGPVHGHTEEVAAALERIAKRSGFGVSHASVSEPLDEARLSRYCALVFVHGAAAGASTAVRRELRRFVEAGGGAIFIHAPVPPTNDWGTARRWLGLRRAEHAEQRQRRVFEAAAASGSGLVVDTGWHRLSDLLGDSEVLLRADDGQPVAWRRRAGGGSIFASDLGHDPASLASDFAAKHLMAGIEWAAAPAPVDYANTSAPVGSYEKRVLARNVVEPIALALLPGDDGSLLFTERRGALKLYEPGGGEARVVGQIEVDASGEAGLLGIALDPSFEKTGWLYLLATLEASGDAPRRHRVSRFTYQREARSLDLSSERLLLEIPLDPEAASHAGGALAISEAGDLFVATGDETRLEGSDGYAPLDTRAGRETHDAARSAGNTNDLRGKVLRIRSTEDGELLIPTGNLFDEEGRHAGQGRPEIYAMGFRNPFTLALDARDATLYVAEPGPDASRRDPARGPAGVDEINRLAEGTPGNFGWPFFGGDGQPYTARGTQATSPDSPRNESPNNTGARGLPPARPPLLAYGYTTSPLYPELGRGPRSVWVGGAMARPDGRPGTRLLLGDFMRETLHWVDLGEEGGVERLERIAPELRFYDPIHGRVARDGSVYVLEYGAGWYSANADAQLSRLVPVAAADRPRREVRDAEAAVQVADSRLHVETAPSRSFFGGVPVRYQVRAAEGLVSSGVRVSLHEAESLQAARSLGGVREEGASEIWSEHGCTSCHAVAPQPVEIAPSRQELSRRYAKAEEATVDRLIEKIRVGGAGSFGERPMPPHPGLDATTRKRFVQSLLGPARIREIASELPLAGEFEIPQREVRSSAMPRGAADGRVFALRAEYGAGAAVLALRATHFPATEFDESAGVELTGVGGAGSTGVADGVVPREEGSWLRYARLDLRGFANLSLWLVGDAKASGALVELHAGSPVGPQLGETATLRFADGALTEASFALEPSPGSEAMGRDIFVVFRRGRARADSVLLSIDLH